MVIILVFTQKQNTAYNQEDPHPSHFLLTLDAPKIVPMRNGRMFSLVIERVWFSGAVCTHT